MISWLRPRRVLLLLLLAGAGVGWWYWERAGETNELGARAALDALGDGGPARRGLPAPGVYTYRQTGEEAGGVGPITVDRTLPDRARLIVRPTGDGVEQELNLAKEHIEAVRYRRTPQGIRTTWIRTEVTFAGFGRDDRRAPRPAPFAIPADLTTGRTWTQRYRIGSLDATATGRVLGPERVEIGGRQEPAVVIRTRTRTSGTHPGTEESVVWWSARLALPLRWELQRNVTGVAKLRVRTVLELESVTPAR